MKSVACMWIVVSLAACAKTDKAPTNLIADSSAPNPTSVARADTPNLVAPQKPDERIDSVLSPSMRQALYALAPDFRAYRREQYDSHFVEYNKEGGDYGLSIVRAHLNADSVSDVALLGRGQTVSYFIALLSNSDGTYQAVHVEPPIPLDVKDTTGRGIYIERQAPGRIDLYVTTEIGRYLTLRSDGIILNIGTEGALIFFLKDGKFVHVGYGD